MSDRLTFQCPAVIKTNGIATKADGTIDVTLNTQEQSPAMSAALFSMRGKYGQFAFVESDKALEDDELNKLDVPEASPEFKGEKSAGQRLRAVIYRYWEQQGKPMEFELFYKIRIEKIIDQYKDKLQ